MSWVKLWLGLTLVGALGIGLNQFWFSGSRPPETVPAAGVPYFSGGVFAQAADAGDYLAERYSDGLRRTREPPLIDMTRADPQRTAYRILALPTFGPPTVVRIERSGHHAPHWRRVTLDGDGGYDLGNIWHDSRSPLDPGEWDRLTNLIEQADFWHLPTRIDRSGFDGTDWVIEGIRNGQYHVVTRWSPPPGPFRDLGRALLDQSPRVLLHRTMFIAATTILMAVGLVGLLGSLVRSWRVGQSDRCPDPEYF